MAPISNLQPSIKAQFSNRGGEPSVQHSPTLLCSHVSENKPITGHLLPVSGTDEQFKANCLNRSDWWLVGVFCGLWLFRGDGATEETGPRNQGSHNVHSCKIRKVSNMDCCCIDKMPLSETFN